MKAIDTLRKLRLTTLKGIEGLSAEQLNKIPEGYNNNIIWNLAHLIAGQQSICYTRAGLPTPVEESFVNAYKPGTKPEKVVTESGIEYIKALLFSKALINWKTIITKVYLKSTRHLPPAIILN